MKHAEIVLSFRLVNWGRVVANVSVFTSGDRGEVELDCEPIDSLDKKLSAKPRISWPTTTG